MQVVVALERAHRPFGGGAEVVVPVVQQALDVLHRLAVVAARDDVVPVAGEAADVPGPLRRLAVVGR